MVSSTILATLSSAFALIPSVTAAFSASASNNFAVYWGQNSGGGTGTSAQQRLSYYCANTDFNIIPLAFLITIAKPVLNFANAGDICTAIDGSTLFYCSQLEADIAECQTKYSKTIILSIGGATYTEGGFTSTSAATDAATNLWKIFGPKTDSTSPRPFGASVIDGFDFDFESTVSNMVPFANQLRSVMTASTATTGKNYILTAAPQCVYPDAADNEMLNGQVEFDAIFVQFYNNFCGIQNYVAGSSTQSTFNFAQWDTWAKTVSKNKNVKVMLGVPATAAAGGGYQTPSALGPIITYCKTFTSFGGVMTWDMTQAYTNSGFLDGVKSALGGSSSSGGGSSASGVVTSTTVAPTGTSTATTLVTSTKPATTKAVGSSSTNSPGGVFIQTTTSTGAIATGGASSPYGNSTTTSSAAVATGGASSGSGGAGVAQWGQCGGEGYTGSTTCASPYKCVATGAWWSQCE